MKTQVKQYEFINSQTGNILGYVTLPSGLGLMELKNFLEKRRQEIAIFNSLFIGFIYWQDHEHCIR